MSRSTPSADEAQSARNRRIVRILISIMGALAAATLLRGVRW
jgi:hypothetical protein